MDEDGVIGGEKLWRRRKGGKEREKIEGQESREERIRTGIRGKSPLDFWPT